MIDPWADAIIDDSPAPMNVFVHEWQQDMKRLGPIFGPMSALECYHRLDPAWRPSPEEERIDWERNANSDYEGMVGRDGDCCWVKDERGLRACWKLDRKFKTSPHSKRTYAAWKTEFLALPIFKAMTLYYNAFAVKAAAEERACEAEQPGRETLVLQNLIQGCTELVDEGFPEEHKRSALVERLRVHLELHPESPIVADRLRQETERWYSKQRRRHQWSRYRRSSWKQRAAAA
jgi:hypothetical protein